MHVTRAADRPISTRRFLRNPKMKPSQIDYQKMQIQNHQIHHLRVKILKFRVGFGNTHHSEGRFDWSERQKKDFYHLVAEVKEDHLFLGLLVFLFFDLQVYP